jgi:hypothetical protein
VGAKRQRPQVAIAGDQSREAAAEAAASSSGAVLGEARGRANARKGRNPRGRRSEGPHQSYQASPTSFLFLETHTGPNKNMHTLHNSRRVTHFSCHRASDSLSTCWRSDNR